MRTMFRPALALLTLFCFTACGGDQGGPGEEPMATVSFLSSPPAYIKTLAVTVTGPGITAPMVFNLTIDSATHIASGTITVPAGSNRHIIANAFDSLGVNTHRGETTVTLVEGANPPVNFTMVSLVGSVSIQISFGSSVLLLTPGDTAVSVGDTVSFIFAGTDEHGAPITGPVWGVSNPAVASYVGNGKVVARAEGNAAVTVNVGFGAITRTVTVARDTAPAPAHEILFESDSTGVAQLYWMNPDGSDVTLVPTGLSNASEASLSADGAKMAFISSGEVYVMNADGTGRQQLTSAGAPNHGPALSPDGTKVAWDIDFAFDNMTIWVMNADGSNPLQLATQRESSHAAWSADGSKIYWNWNFGFFPGVHIAVMNADGSGQALFYGSGTGDVSSPSESPAGDKIAMWYNNGSSVSIILVDGNGTDQGPLNSGLTVLPPRSRPTWSPDGAFVAYPAGTAADSIAVYVVATSGGAPVRITGQSGNRTVWGWR